jgi:site-specific DNA recombinase
MKRAACYARVSTDDQIEYSPDSQIREMKEYAAHNNILILDEHIYIDEGISGRKALSRPQFQNMISVAKTKPKPFDCVLLYKFSRFARNREDSVVYKSLLRKKCGIEVISISEPLDPDNKMSIIMEAFIEAMDEYYSINLSEDVKRTMTEKAMRGELQCSPQFGYTVENNILVPIETEALLVKEMFSKFIEGDGYYNIARWLNNMGIKTHRGNHFENRTVEYIIRNPVYIGKLRWNPEEHSTRDFDNPNIILVDGKHEPLIDTDMWEAAQKRVKEIKTQWGKYRRPTTTHKDWLSGLVVCANCGNTLINCSGQYWKCNAYAKGACSVSQHISDEKLKSAIFARLKIDIEQTTRINYYVVNSSHEEDELKLCQHRLYNIPQKLQRASEAYLAGADSIEEYKKNKSLILQEESLLRRQIERLNNETLTDQNNQQMKKALVTAYDILTDNKAPLDEKHKAAHNIFRRMVWDKSKNLLKIEYLLNL